jgi:hypothetical protein
MNIDLRPLLPSDQPFLWEMLYQALYVAPGSPPFVRAILDDPDIACYLKGWGRPGDWGLLACAGATLAGGNGRIGRIRMKEAMAMSARSSRKFRSRCCRNIAAWAWGRVCSKR